MHLIYIDEVKYQPPEQPYYWLCGFAVDEPGLRFVDHAATEVADWYFGTSQLDITTEFHAQHIVNGRGNFKGHELGKRIELYKRLIDCLCGHDSIQRIEIRIDPAKVVAGKDPAKTAFMFFAEKCDVLMQRLGSIGVLIADDDSKKTRSTNVAKLSEYRRWETDWHFSRKIENLADTIHHTQSHHSRMVQLADVFVYSCQLQQRDNLSSAKQSLYDYASQQGLYRAAAYKYWPTSESPWFQAVQRNSEPYGSP
ncbi:MAG: DUF3800 domain-containing protein [Gammaproteobacteria bacterium]